MVVVEVEVDVEGQEVVVVHHSRIRSVGRNSRRKSIHGEGTSDASETSIIEAEMARDNVNRPLRRSQRLRNKRANENAHNQVLTKAIQTIQMSIKRVEISQIQLMIIILAQVISQQHQMIVNQNMNHLSFEMDF